MASGSFCIGLAIIVGAVAIMVAGGLGQYSGGGIAGIVFGTVPGAMKVSCRGILWPGGNCCGGP